MELYERVLSILEQSADCAEFEALLQNVLPNKPYTARVGDNTVYTFSDLGFAMSLNRTENRFWMASFVLATETGDGDSLHPFAQPLLRGLSKTDTTVLVEQKLGVKPTYMSSPTADPCRSMFDLPPYRLLCVFGGPDMQLCEVDIFKLPAEEMPSQPQSAAD